MARSFYEVYEPLYEVYDAYKRVYKKACMLVNWKILLMKEKKYRQLYSRSSMYFYVSSFQLLEMFKGWIRLKKIICLCSEFGPIFHIWAFGSNSETNGNRKIKVIR